MGRSPGDGTFDAEQRIQSDPGNDHGRTRTRRDVLIAGGVGMATMAAGCVGSGNTQKSSKTTTTETNQETAFRLHWDRNENIYANITAAEQWTWPKHGVDVTVKTSNGGQAAAKSVASGNESFGSGGYGAVLKLIDSGAPLTVVANFTGPWGGVLSLEDTNITSWMDLEGKTVGQFPFGSTPIVAKAAMKRRGVDISNIKFQNVQPGSGMTSLMKGEIDAMIRYVPQTKARLEMEGYSVNALKSVDVLDHLGLAFFVHDDVLDQNRELVDGMVAGFIDGIRYWAENHDEVIEAQKKVASESQWKPKLNDRMTGPVYAAQAPPTETGLEHGKGWISEGRLQKTIDIFHEAGAIDSKPSMESIYTNEFVENNQSLAIDTAKALYDKLDEFDVGPNYI